jgi:uncharacterized protein YndB with AHSA1/START domain
MYDILHRVGIRARPTDVFSALSTREGLAAWWTNDTRGNSRIGEVLQFRFGERGGFDMRVLASEPDRRVTWQVTQGPQEWLDTRIDWNLEPDDDYTVVQFRHMDWKQQTEFMHHCSTKWAVFLMSLKSLLETGMAAPWPRDVPIDKAEAVAQGGG